MGHTSSNFVEVRRNLNTLFEHNWIGQINIDVDMVRSIYLLAVFTQIIWSVSAQDYCADQCKDKPDDVVCTCVLCPVHTCEDGEKECSEENVKCTTINKSEEEVVDLVCPISTHCVAENCDCPTLEPPCPAVCHECEIGQPPTPECMICCPGQVGPNGCKDPNVCIPIDNVTPPIGDDGENCEAFCPHDCVEDENNICCTNEKEANGCAKPPGPLIETPKKNPECDVNFCPCKCPNPDTGKCCEAPKDNNGCDMEEEKCVEKKKDSTGEYCPEVHCPKVCDPIEEILQPACHVCDADKCCRKSKDANGLFCPDDYDHGCDHCDCCEGMCCDGCVETLGCKPKGECIPPDAVPKDNEGNDCPKESVCPCCCAENEICCDQGIGPDGCKIPEKCEPKMPECLITHCECIPGLTCEVGEICCPGHKDDKGCFEAPVCKDCGVKTKGEEAGCECDCFCPASCELQREIACKSQIGCDGCPEPEMCLPRAKNLNGVYCPEDSASHGCPLKCNEENGEVPCESEVDVLGCKPPKTCVQRDKDINGNSCPCETACPVHCPSGMVVIEGGEDALGCPMQSHCEVPAAPPVVPVESPVEPPAEEPAIPVVAPVEPPAEEAAPAEVPAEREE